MTLTPDILRAVMPNVKRAEEWATLLGAAAAEFEIDSRERLACWLANIAIETSDLSALRENLSYSADGLQAMAKLGPSWARFRDRSTAEAYAHRPDLIANTVYANRMGNGPLESGDGYRYRGGGPPMLTGLAAYMLAKSALGVDLVAHPEMIEERGVGARVAGWFWKWKNISPHADAGDFETVVHLWTGGHTAYSKRWARYTRAYSALAAVGPKLPMAPPGNGA